MRFCLQFNGPARTSQTTVPFINSNEIKLILLLSWLSGAIIQIRHGGFRHVHNYKHQFE